VRVVIAAIAARIPPCAFDRGRKACASPHSLSRGPRPRAPRFASGTPTRTR
jgi:hypothetical protein